MSNDLDGGGSSSLSSVKESQELLDLEVSLYSKASEQRKLEDKIADFLSGGGKISHIESNVTASPPKKPESNYGGQLK